MPKSNMMGAPPFGMPNALFNLGQPQERVVNRLTDGPRQWGNRENGTPKGAGFLGPLPRPFGGLSTELSVGMNINGKETLLPLLVPTLDQSEVHWLLNNEPGPDYFRRMPPTILQKAQNHAMQRMALGKSPFLD